MKLCKDCKHIVAATHPLSNATGGPYYRESMCAHPDAKRSVVDGSLQTTCIEARGANDATNLTICWKEAKLFEEAPPAPQFEPKPYQTTLVETVRDKSFWEKAKRWFI